MVLVEEQHGLLSRMAREDAPDMVRDDNAECAHRGQLGRAGVGKCVMMGCGEAKVIL